jgi:hypothetical protein
MEINYQETSKDLLTRIDIHEKYGSANIDQWTNDLLKPQAGMNILDVGCGAGKLSFLFNDYTKGEAKITGGDFSEELLDKARAKNKELGANIDFQFWISMVGFADNTSTCTSAFAIYYASIWTLHLVRLIGCLTLADGSSSPAHCLRTSRCSTRSSKKPPTQLSLPCPVHPASRVISSTPSIRSLPRLNYINSKITSHSPKCTVHGLRPRVSWRRPQTMDIHVQWQ